MIASSAEKIYRKMTSDSPLGYPPTGSEDDAKAGWVRLRDLMVLSIDDVRDYTRQAWAYRLACTVTEILGGIAAILTTVVVLTGYLESKVPIIVTSLTTTICGMSRAALRTYKPEKAINASHELHNAISAVHKDWTLHDPTTGTTYLQLAIAKMGEIESLRERLFGQVSLSKIEQFERRETNSEETQK